MRKAKVFLDIEKEVKWLNEMSSKGYRLVDKSFGDYMFEQCESNKFVYEVQKTTFKGTDEEEDYAAFLTELGINIVKCRHGWWYLEKANDGKAFELFTDADSKIGHYQKLTQRLVLLSLISWILVIQNLQEPTGPWILNISFPLVSNIIILALIYHMVWKYWERIKKLREKNSLQER